MLDADGNDVESGIVMLNPYRYCGYYYDKETDLYYLQTRYYDPETGRFISQDDVSYLNPDSINGLNLYAYCSNNPVMAIDPTGTTEWWEWLLGVVIIVAAVALSFVTAGLAGPIATALGGGLFGAILGGAVAGAVGGAITGFGISLATQGISNGFDNIDGFQLFTDTVYSAAAGLIAGGIFGGIKHVLSAQKIANALSGLDNAEKAFEKAFEKAQSVLQKTPIAIQGGVMSTERVSAQLVFNVASANLGNVQSVYNTLKLVCNGVYNLLEYGASYGIGLIPGCFGG